MMVTSTKNGRARKFQSYLYGIEILLGVSDLFQIHRFQSYLYGIEIGGRRNCWSVAQKFQSYLYGIEILEKRLLHIYPSRFNRTFMELKYTISKLRMPTTPQFQSYLYGIEMPETNSRRQQPTVSIVPLWN